MRILQLTNKVPWPPTDGGAIATLTLSKGFFILGHQVSILAMRTEKHNTRLDEIPEHLAAQIDFNLVDVPARITFWGGLVNFLFSDLPYIAARFISEDYSRALIKLLKEKEFDVIQLEGLYLCPYIPLIKQYSKALIAYRAHNIEYEIWERSSKLSGGFRRIYLSILTRRIKKFGMSYINEWDVLVSITERDGEMLDKLGNRKPRITSQTGIDFSTLVPTAKDLEFPSLFHIGSLEWGPNQEGLLWFINNVWPLIYRKYPELKFYIAGRNAPGWLAQKLKLANVVFLGEIEDAYQFMNSKAVMIVPLRSGSGMRIKIVEGLALGKAIVSTTIGVEGIAAEDHEHILIANEPHEFVHAVSELIENKALYKKLCKNAVEFIREKFDNLAIVSSLVDFYKKQLNG
ncbi:glycosyltransferase family 4 protein [Mangrovibacterium diazotrophicum]|uniref:Glycosyltransferase involved in cell wall biosynthesis n=1 Tax=Mangrovibacterium diazotrophicum TaxID=1261403 RepID=A0A419VWS3_9BACT|nr:glycosyltransferase family 4 protein [Mangrovibacterium diazotrophicum]RKD87681.1 glycosyltransferase involved in cell wall biosynthesis [Mangrovibacterium diazotrophicum]